jgi:phage shock protein PspC (stress-responsive transcriptional regulator)
MARSLTRDRTRAVAAGVAAGFARYLDVDPVLVRFVLVVLTFFHGIGLLLYLVGWAVIPPSDAPAAGARRTTTAAPGDTAAPGADDPTSVGTGDPGLPPPLPGETAAPPPLPGQGSAEPGRRVVGWALVVLGGALLLHNLDWIRWPHWANLSTLWPLALVGMGVAMLRRSIENEAL